MKIRATKGITLTVNVISSDPSCKDVNPISNGTLERFIFIGGTTLQK